MTSLDKQHIDDNDLVARYLADQLSESERVQFEEYYLRHPEMLEEINRTAQFKAGLMDLRDDGSLDALIAEPSAPTRTPYFAIAASLIALVVGATIFTYSSTSQLAATSVNELTGRFSSELQVQQSISILRTRSVFSDATVALPAQPAAIALHVMPDEASASGRYRFSVSKVMADGTTLPISKLNALPADNEGFVTVYLNSGLLTPGDYFVWVLDNESAELENTDNAFTMEVTQ
jgi:hypothetical protein